MNKNNQVQKNTYFYGLISSCNTWIIS